MFCLFCEWLSFRGWNSWIKQRVTLSIASSNSSSISVGPVCSRSIPLYIHKKNPRQISVKGEGSVILTFSFIPK